MPKKNVIVESLPNNVVNGTRYEINQPNPNSYTHGIFKYPCKFIPEVPRWAIRKFCKNKKSIIFDPFSGSGTTALESNLLGFDAFVTEIDDVCKLITVAKTQKLSRKELKELQDTYIQLSSSINDPKSKISIPDIDNLAHWFSNETINKLGKLKYSIEQITNIKINTFFKVCFASIIKKVSYADDTSPKPYVSNKIIKKPKSVEDEWESTYRRYFQMVEDFSKLKKIGKTSFVCGDALNINTNKCFDLVITSPPYINAFDYGRAMRLENLWLGYLSEEELRSKKTKYVGTEKIDINLEKEDLKILDSSLYLKRYFNKIYKTDKKRALIVKKFFNDIEINLIQVYNHLKNNGKYVIVIGNSNIRNVKIESWKVIKDLAIKIGYKDIAYFSYVIKNPYIRIPRNGKGGKIQEDYVLVLKKR